MLLYSAEAIFAVSMSPVSISKAEEDGRIDW